MREPTHPPTPRLQSLLWPLLLLALGGVALLLGLEAFPPAVADLIGRAWPVILVLAGLVVFLDQSGLRRWAAPLAVLVSGALLAGIIVVAYTSRASTEREDNVVAIEQPIGPGVQRLVVMVQGLQTRVDIAPADREEPTITGEFSGSIESEIEQDYAEEGGTARFTLRETRPSAIPALEAVGRGRLNVALPPGLPLELTLRNADGAAVLNLLGLEVTRLNINIAAGDLLLSLPDTALEQPGDVVVTRGNVTLFVPDDLGLHLFVNGPVPQFAAADYLLDPSDGSYLSRNFDDFQTQMTLNLTVSSGSIRLE